MIALLHTCLVSTYNITAHSDFAPKFDCIMQTAAEGTKVRINSESQVMTTARPKWCAQVNSIEAISFTILSIYLCGH